MPQENIWFHKNDNESFDMLDLCLDSNNNKLFGYKDSYYYYDIDAKKILLIKSGYNKHIIRYYYANKMAFVPLQIKIKNFFYVNYIYLQTMIEQYLFIVMIKNFLKNVEKYRIR